MLLSTLPEVPPPDTDTAHLSAPSPRRRRSLGCWLFVVLWFVCIATVPCGLFIFITRGEWTLTLGDLPDHELRVWLIMEIDERGLGISQPSVYTDDDPNRVCVQTSVRYALWLGEADPNIYCNCYERDDDSAAWSFVASQPAPCSPR